MTPTDQSPAGHTKEPLPEADEVIYIIYKRGRPSLARHLPPSTEWEVDHSFEDKATALEYLKKCREEVEFWKRINSLGKTLEFMGCKKVSTFTRIESPSALTPATEKE